MAHSYDVGTRAWQPDPSEGWIASEVESKKIAGDKVTLVFALANGEVSFQFPSRVDETLLYVTAALDGMGWQFDTGDIRARLEGRLGNLKSLGRHWMRRCLIQPYHLALLD